MTSSRKCTSTSCIKHAAQKRECFHFWLKDILFIYFHITYSIHRFISDIIMSIEKHTDTHKKHPNKGRNTHVPYMTRSIEPVDYFVTGYNTLVIKQYARILSVYLSFFFLYCCVHVFFLWVSIKITFYILLLQQILFYRRLFQRLSVDSKCWTGIFSMVNPRSCCILVTTSICALRS